MLARSLIPCLSIPAPGPADPGLDAEDWLDRARRLEDDGADELLIAVDGGVPARLAGMFAEALSVSVMADAGVEGFDAWLDGGADKAVLAADAPGLPQAVQRWGSSSVVARLELQRAVQAHDAVAAGACELLVSWPTGMGGVIAALRALSDQVRVPVIAAGPFAGLEQVRQALHEGRAEAVALPVEMIDQARGILEVKRYLAAAGIVVRGMS